MAANGPDGSYRKEQNKELFNFNSMFQKVLDTSNFVTFGKSSIKYLITIDE